MGKTSVPCVATSKTPPQGPSPRFLLALILFLFFIVGFDFYNRFRRNLDSKDLSLS